MNVKVSYEINFHSEMKNEISFPPTLICIKVMNAKGKRKVWNHKDKIYIS